MGLDIKPVIVTALFDIGRDKWAHHTQSYGGYMHWMERTLSIQTPMVIYTEEQFIEQIKETRNRYFNQSQYIITTKEELEVSKLFYEDISKLMSSEEFKKKIQFQVPEMLEPWYNILMLNKMWWLNDARNWIKGTHYIWTDAGCYREEIEKVNKPFPTHKIQNKPIFFSHHQEISIENIQHHILAQMRFIQGGSFIIPTQWIDILTDKLKSAIQTQIQSGYIGSDEKFLDILYLQNKEHMQLVKCSWREYMEVMS